ncbi:hypothetical protein IFR05_010873 [Cadophora sp. M221]|nr:hypothetical protein IFR05_010873 [Cadophora sp. M221]
MYEAILGKVDAVTAALGLGRGSHRVLPGDNPWGYYSGGGSGESSSTTKQEQTSSSFEKDGKNEMASARSSLTLVEKAEVGRD